MAMLGTQVLILLVYLLIPMVGFGALQVYLSGRKNKKTGWILPALAFVLAAVMTVNLWVTVSKDTYYDGRFGDETIDDVKIYINVNTNEDGSVRTFSDLEVRNRETGEKTYYALEFDEKGKLIGGEEALQLPYKDEIPRLVGEDFTGKSVSMRQLKWDHVKEHPRLIVIPAIITLIIYIPCIVFIVIYRVMRRRVREKYAAQGLEKMMIDDL